MQRYTVFFYLETALHVSGGTTTNHQEHKQLYVQHLVFVTTLLLSWKSWNWFKSAVGGVRCDKYQMLYIQLFALLMMGGGTTRNM